MNVSLTSIPSVTAGLKWAPDIGPAIIMATNIVVATAIGSVELGCPLKLSANKSSPVPRASMVQTNIMF